MSDPDVGRPRGDDPDVPDHVGWPVATKKQPDGGKKGPQKFALRVVGTGDPTKDLVLNRLRVDEASTVPQIVGRLKEVDGVALSQAAVKRVLGDLMASDAVERIAGASLAHAPLAGGTLGQRILDKMSGGGLWNADSLASAINADGFATDAVTVGLELATLETAGKVEEVPTGSGNYQSQAPPAPKA